MHSQFGLTIQGIKIKKMAAELLGGCILMLATYMSSFLGSWFDALIRRTLDLCTYMYVSLSCRTWPRFVMVSPSTRTSSCFFQFASQSPPEESHHIRTAWEDQSTSSNSFTDEGPRNTEVCAIALGDSPKLKKTIEANDWGTYSTNSWKLVDWFQHGRSQINFYQWTSRLEFSEEGLVNVPHYLSVSSRKQSPISKSQNQVNGESSCPAESPSQYRYFLFQLITSNN